jgi:hypothetical protein
MSRLPAAALALSVLGSTGCAQNAIFELYVEVPPPVTIGAGTVRARFARVFLLPGEVSSDQLWDGPRSRVVALDDAGPRSIGLSIVRGIAGEADPISVRIAYCAEERDCQSNDPRDWVGREDLVFDRVFYRARTTCYAHTLSDRNVADGLTLASTTVRIDRCAVAGCVDGSPTEVVDFCNGAGQHFCELGRSGNLCDELHARLEDRLLTARLP